MVLMIVNFWTSLMFDWVPREEVKKEKEQKDLETETSEDELAQCGSFLAFDLFSLSQFHSYQNETFVNFM